MQQQHSVTSFEFILYTHTQHLILLCVSKKHLLKMEKLENPCNFMAAVTCRRIYKISQQCRQSVLRRSHWVFFFFQTGNRRLTLEDRAAHVCSWRDRCRLIGDSLVPSVHHCSFHTVFVHLCVHLFIRPSASTASAFPLSASQSVLVFASVSVISVEALSDCADVWLTVHPDLPENPFPLL